MTAYYVDSGGSNTSPYDTWAKAATSMATVIALIASGDVVYTDNTFNQLLASDTTYAAAVSDFEVISTSDTTNQPPTTYAAGATLTGNANGVDITINRGVWRGFNFLTGSGGTSAFFFFNSAAGDVLSLEDCTFENRSTNAGGAVQIGTAVAGSGRLSTRNCSFKWGATGQGFSVRTINWTDEGSEFVTSTGSVPTNLFEFVDRGANMFFDGSNLSNASGNLYSAGVGTGYLQIANASLHASLAYPALTADGFVALLLDCHSGDEHYHMRHIDFRGSTVTVTAIAMNSADAAKYDGTNEFSWEVTGNANATFELPYQSPWIDVYHSDSSAITPRLEIMRDGSTSAYTNEQIWPEVMAKTTSGSTRSTLYTGRRGPLASAANVADGVGLSAWDGEAGSAKSMKLEPSSSLTPAEIGFMRMRVCVGDNITAYVNPKILGL